MKLETIVNGVEKVTDTWYRQKKREERDRRARLHRSDYMDRSYRRTVRDAAFEVMAQAYLKASGNGQLPASARQIMYAARPFVQDKTSRTLDDKYFTQTLLPGYINTHPDQTRDWDVVYDARGQFIEPHATLTHNSPVPLGTLQVREYLNGTDSRAAEFTQYTIPHLWPTHGPRHRYTAILFIEKEGFFPLFSKARLAERHDIGIMTTKGMSVIAARHMIDALCGQFDIPLLVVHDFDSHGMVIAGSLTYDTDRYQFQSQIRVIDFGLRLADVKRYQLQDETATGRRPSDAVLKMYGATQAEIKFLRDRRVELNAFTSDALIEWLEAKLQRHGIQKVVPDENELARAYRHMVKVRRLEAAMQHATKRAEREAKHIDVPAELQATIRRQLANDPSQPWDQVLYESMPTYLDDAEAEARLEADGDVDGDEEC